jgi:hypothetical protein
MHTFQMQVWWTLHQESLYPYHYQYMQALQPEDYTAQTDFCHCIVEQRQLVKHILLCDEAKFMRDGITSCHCTMYGLPVTHTIPLQATS